MVETLLEEGADVMLVNSRNETALTVAKDVQVHNFMYAFCMCVCMHACMYQNIKQR